MLRSTTCTGKKTWCSFRECRSLKGFQGPGYKLVVITNQAGVARGYYTEEDVKELHRYMNELLAGTGRGD